MEPMPQTGFEEMTGYVLEPDFWPGITCGYPVIRPQSVFSVNCSLAQKDAEVDSFLSIPTM